MADVDALRGRLAELAVAAANVQPGQVVAVASQPGREALALAVTTAAYRRGARFVDVNSFDLHVKRERILHSPEEHLDYVPPWYGARLRALGELHAARIGFTGPSAPGLFADLDPARLAKDPTPFIPEARRLLHDASTNWVAVPAPSLEWARLLFPDAPPEEALEALWRDIARVCRLDEPEPAAAWQARADELTSRAAAMSALGLDALRFEGPGTRLTVGLLPTSAWLGGRLETAWGLEHIPNVPTEEVFTAPDPQRVEGEVRSTKPLVIDGTTVSGLRVRFEGGRAVAIDADEGADVLRAMTGRDEGGARLGEVALVDRESRVGQVGRVFYDTLLDENAASHIALGMAYPGSCAEEDRERANTSVIHLDFMIGGDDVAVTGLTRDGGEVPLLREGAWQLRSS